MSFGTALPNVINVIVYGVYDAVMAIDKNRNVAVTYV